MSKTKLINQIINQANSLNKKIKQFKQNGVEDHLEFIKAMFNDKQMKYNESDSLTKSKKFYKEQNELQLQRTLNVLKRINNHDTYGTVRKYKQVQTKAWTTLMSTVEAVLIKKGYSEQEVNMVIHSKQYHDALMIAFKDVSKGFGSEQAIEKIYLQYANEGLSEEDINKAVSDIEYSVSKIQEAEQHTRDYLEFLDMKRGKR